MTKNLALWAFFVGFCLLCPKLSQAQDFRCGFDSIYPDDENLPYYRQEHLQRINDYRNAHPTPVFLPNGASPGSTQGSGSGTCYKARYIIPVVVHVIHAPTDTSAGMGSNISQAQIENQISKLNDFLANAGNVGSPAVNTGIQLCLATRKPDGTAFSGVVRLSHTLSTHTFPGQVASLLSLSYFPPEQYLNIYVVKSILDDSGATGIRGYGMHPDYIQNLGGGREGVVVRSDYFGDYNTCTSCALSSGARGKVMAHELGHWLGLYHTFQDGCAGVSTMPCSVQGDRCCDTPPSALGQYTCNNGRNTCQEPNDKPDLAENFMEYSGENCWTSFTVNQAEIMYATLDYLKATLIDPVNVNKARPECCRFSARFSLDKVVGCLSDTLQLTALDSISGASYRWRVYKNGSQVYQNTTAGSHLAYLPGAIGRYGLELSIFAQGDSISFQASDSFDVVDCGVPVNSEKGNWCFGDLCGLKFTPTTVAVDPNLYINRPNINAFEGCISQSNAYGGLLFYGGGNFEPVSSKNIFSLYNKNYNLMDNSDSLWMDMSASQGAICLPMPNNGSKYYLILGDGYFPATKGLRYSIIDTAGNGGLGTVLNGKKNIPILPPPNGGSQAATLDSSVILGEGITAIPQCNEKDYWLIFRDGSDVFSSYTNAKNILVYAVTDSGIFYHSRYQPPNSVSFGVLKASPDGRFLYGWGQVFRFNRSTGTITGLHFTTNNLDAYAGSFSPDSKLLYVLHSFDPFGSGSQDLYQYDLYAANPIASRKFIQSFGTHQGHLQEGPDGKIYVSKFGSNRLAVISRPNLRDSVQNACGFSLNGPLLQVNGKGGTARIGLPNFVDARIPSEIPTDFNYKVSSCRTLQLYPNTTCASSISWNFGNGQSSTDLEPTHVYSHDSTYTVTMTVGSVSVSKQIVIGIPKPLLAGDSLFCDSSQLYNYSTTPNDRYQYQWTLTNGVLLGVQNSYAVDVRWLDEGRIKLQVTSLHNGCTDTTSIAVHRRTPPILNNSISSNQLLCNTLQAAKITGTHPQGGNGVYSYRWKMKTDTSAWAYVSGATDSQYTPAPNTHTMYLLREAESYGCSAFSNEVSVKLAIRNNEISLTQEPCVRQSLMNLQGNTPVLYDSSNRYNFQWQYSLNGLSNWTSISASDSLHLSWASQLDSVYVRRQVQTSVCNHNSNQLQVKPKIHFRRQPVPYSTCGPNGTYRFTVDAFNKSDTTLHFAWQVKDNGSSTWPGISVGQNDNDTFIYSSSKSFSLGDSVRCVLVSSCGNVASTTTTLYINSYTPNYTSHPSDNSIIEGGTAYFDVSVDSTRGLTYGWQYSADQGQSWQYIDSASLLYYEKTAIPYCWHKRKYRAVINNGCGGNRYSNPANLLVSTSSTHTLMMKDAVTDNGTEPSLNNIWESPDIWVSKNNSVSYDYSNSKIEYTSLNKPYVKVRVQNTGSQSSPAAKVVVYWTLAKTREIWPDAWLDTPANRYNGKAMGGVIDTLILPGLNAGGDTILVAQWKKIPRPSDFGFNDSSGVMACLLARILTCTEAPYAMSYPETRDIYNNVRFNRKVITKNFMVVDQNSADFSVPISIGNNKDQAATARLEIRNRDCQYQNYGTVTLHLDAPFRQYWYNPGANGSGFTILNDSTLRLDSCVVTLETIDWDSAAAAMLHLHGVADEGISRYEPMPFTFDILQYEEADSFACGGLIYEVWLPQNDTAEGGWNAKNKKPGKAAQEETARGAFKAWPNPFNDELTLACTLDADARLTVTVYNMYGQLVQEICEQQLLTKGKHTFSTDTRMLAEGVYFVCFSTGNITQTEKIVLLR